MLGTLKKYSTVFIILASVFVGALLLQLWFEPFQGAFFWKFLFTLFMLGTLLAFIVVVKSDLDTSSQQKKDKFLG